MNAEMVRLVQNLDATLRRFNAEQLFTLAQSMAVELERRALPAALEARALQLALVPAARELFQLRRAAEESDPP